MAELDVSLNMKYIIPSLIVGLLASLNAAAQPKTDSEFVSAVRQAITSKDADKIDALTYQVGMTEGDKATAKRVQEMLIGKPTSIQEIALEPLPPNMQTSVIMRGKRIEMTNPPVGIIKISYDPNSSGSQSSSIPYTVVDGLFYLTGSKTTDLDWNGPTDINIGFMVIGVGQDNVKIEVTWNASGVTQTQEFNEPSTTFWGQHIDSMTVTSDSDDTSVKLQVLEAGETIYTSEQLKGKGTIQYTNES